MADSDDSKTPPAGPGGDDKSPGANEDEAEGELDEPSAEFSSAEGDLLAEGDVSSPLAGNADLGRSQGLPPSPAQVTDLAEACVRFVERLVGVRLDFQPETLPLLDHWLREGSSAAEGRPEAAPLVAHAAGAYFGEVVRRRHASWWRVEAADPASWRLELRDVYLSFAPVDIARDALRLERGPDGEDLDVTSFDLDEDDREAVAERLAELPPVDEDEYRAPSTRLEVLDIVVETLRQRQVAREEPPLTLEPGDYGPTVH